MRCDTCPACHITEYAESYEQDFYCRIGIDDNARFEFKDLSLGCKTPYNKIIRILKDVDNESQ